MADRKSKIHPPDLNQCQVETRELPSAANFLQIGWSTGHARWERCTNKPTIIATENKPGKDGQVGTMAICDKCFAVMHKQVTGVSYRRL